MPTRTSGSTLRFFRHPECVWAKTRWSPPTPTWWAGTHLYDRIDQPVLYQGRTAQGIEVDDNVWLGAHVVVSDGSKVGRDAIIGAGAVVIGDVPPFHIAAGVPAQTIRDRRAGPEAKT